MVAAGCPLDAQNACGESALHLSAANGHTYCTRMLLLAGADASSRTLYVYCFTKLLLFLALITLDLVHIG